MLQNAKVTAFTTSEVLREKGKLPTRWRGTGQMGGWYGVGKITSCGESKIQNFVKCCKVPIYCDQNFPIIFTLLSTFLTMTSFSEDDPVFTQKRYSF